MWIKSVLGNLLWPCYLLWPCSLIETSDLCDCDCVCVHINIDVFTFSCFVSVPELVIVETIDTLGRIGVTSLSVKQLIRFDINDRNYKVDSNFTSKVYLVPLELGPFCRDSCGD